MQRAGGLGRRLEVQEQKPSQRAAYLETLDELLTRRDPHRVELLSELQLLGKEGWRRLDLQCEERGGSSRTIGVEGHSLANLITVRVQAVRVER